jgi:hypothetical protein
MVRSIIYKLTGFHHGMVRMILRTVFVKEKEAHGTVLPMSASRSGEISVKVTIPTEE